jgi:hypothetical protein
MFQSPKVFLFVSIVTLHATLFADEPGQVDEANSSWIAHFQTTYIWQKKPEFHSAYSGSNSLSAADDKSYTWPARKIARPVFPQCCRHGALQRCGCLGAQRRHVGHGVVENNISAAHRAYLAAGGLGFFLGDGQLIHYHFEDITEIYYNLQPIKDSG